VKIAGICLHIGKLVWSEVSFNNSGMNREVHVPLCERLAGRLRRSTRLFMGNPKGARSASIIYSLVITAKANGLDPWQYLMDVLTKAPYCETDADYAKLIPASDYFK